jgi:hypothetical protein
MLLTLTFRPKFWTMLNTVKYMSKTGVVKNSQVFHGALTPYTYIQTAAASGMAS